MATPTQAPVVIYFDAAVEPINPGGYGCWAWVALAQDATEVMCDFGCVGRRPDITNNAMEYHALIQALTWLHDQGITGLVVRGDSQLVVQQVTGAWACNSPHLKPLRQQAADLVDALDVRLQWVPREKNARADGYTRQAYAHARGSRHAA